MKVAINLEKSQVAEYYRQMLLIRQFEEASERLYMQGQIRGFMHPYIGQEAIAVGSIPALNGDDYVVTHYRDHGPCPGQGHGPQGGHGRSSAERPLGAAGVRVALCTCSTSPGTSWEAMPSLAASCPSR